MKRERVFSSASPIEMLERWTWGHLDKPSCLKDLKRNKGMVHVVSSQLHDKDGEPVVQGSL